MTAAKTKSIEKTPKAHEPSTPSHAFSRQPAPSGPQGDFATPAMPREAGNMAVQRLFRAGAIQAKLSISQPGDPDEQEADHMSNQFVSGQKIQRKCSSCEREDETAHRSANGPAPPRLASGKSAGLGLDHGSPLPRSTQRDYESFFRTDLSQVRVHSYSQAFDESRKLSARAFTIGNNVVFADGEYSPNSESGRKLLAHELTHVVQQSGGTPGAVNGAEQRAIRAIDERVQADNGLTERDIAMIRLWLEGGSGAHPSEHSVDRPSSWPTLLPSRRHLSPEADTQGLPRIGRDFLPRATAVAVCPSCHQTPDELWAAAQRREAERREAQRRAAWPGMHRTQHEDDLRQQAESLREDVESGELIAAQLRLQMFDRTLASRRPGNMPSGLHDAPEETITPNLRDKWAQAQQATAVLNALSEVASAPPPLEVIAPIKSAYLAYYDALSTNFAALDRRDRRQREALRAFQSSGGRLPQCPGGCHQPSQPLAPSFTSSFSSTGGQFASRRFIPVSTSRGIPSNQPFPDTSEPIFGPHQQRLTLATTRVISASTYNAWHVVLEDYRWSTAQLDALLRSRLQRDMTGSDLLEQFDFTQALLERQQQFLVEHPDALKVQAVFYPKHEFTTREDEQGRSREIARGIPWHFYLTRTPVTDSRYVPTGYEWQLHDITAPRRDNRTVRKSYQISAIEALARERGPWRDQLPIDQMDPPSTLFTELNHRDFFPEGMLYWRYPLSGRPGELETTAPRPFGEWLTFIGMGIAILGSLVFAPFSTPMLLSVGVGTGLTIAGRLNRLGEMEAHGVLTQGDVDRFYWDLSLDIINALTLGLGRVLTVSARAGNLLRATSTARAYFIVRRAQISMDVINVGIVTNDFVQQYRAIQDSNLTPEQKNRALTNLTMHAMLAGLLTFVQLRSGLHDWNRRPLLSIDIDPSNPSRLVADLHSGADVAEHLSTRARDDAHIVGRASYRHPDTGEEHSFALWSDGRITRCSAPPCPQIAESIVGRLDTLSDHMLTESRYSSELQALAARARQLREEAERLANRPVAEMTAQKEPILARTRQLEQDMTQLERNVATENRTAEITGRGEAQRRYGDAALNYNTEHYRWVWNRRRGTLDFQRRNQAVPWRSFNPETGSFEVTRTLFVAVDPSRLQQLRETTLTKDFRILATVDNIADLRRLRPGSATRTAPPIDWVLVRINDDNLVQFYNEPVAHGVIFEFPDGSRVWRTSQNTIATEGAVRAPIGRRGFEQSGFPQLRVTEHGSNEGVPVLEATGVEHQRAHPRGQGTGFELFNHIPLAPTYINQQLQARGIELFISELHRIHPELDFRLSTEHTTFSGTNRQAWIDYHVYVMRGSNRRQLFTLRIGTDYSNPRAPGEPEIRAVTNNRDDLELLDEVDMPTALAALEARIRNRITGRQRP